MQLFSSDAARQADRPIYWRVIDAIVEDIKNKKYKPGDQIPTEKELVEALHVSRTSVREACKILSALGIVDIVRGKGTYIANPEHMMGMDSLAYVLLLASTKQEQIITFRVDVEQMILRAAVDQVTAEDISKLQAILDQAQEAYEQGDYKRVQEMDVRFHLSILDLTKNPFIIRMVRGVYEFLAREMILKNPNSGEFYESSKKSHVRDLQYLITKGRSGLDRTESIRLAKIYYQY